MRYGDRLERAGAQVGEAGFGALLVPPSPDLRYLTGYDPPPLERLTLLVIRPDHAPVLVVPELERPLALSSPAADRFETASWRDAEDAHQLAARLIPPGARVAVGDRCWASHVLQLQRAFGGEFVASSEALPQLRAIKDADELELLQLAGQGADEAFDDVLGGAFEGTSEIEIGARLGDLLRARGHDDVNFTIVGSGPNGASPHHQPTMRRIVAGDGVVMDFGGRVRGYCSDITRTVCVGEPSSEFSEVFEVVQRAQETALGAVRPGVAAQEIDRAARDVIEAAGYGDAFVHRTGHGIGLEEHEPPYLVRGNPEVLVPGMCFSIEPGIYLEGRFGVRIEDIVTVTGSGVTRLNRAPRELIQVA